MVPTSFTRLCSLSTIVQFLFFADDVYLQISEPATRPRKLGLLAGTFEDGSLSIYAVPDPSDVTPPDHDRSQPVFGLYLISSTSISPPYG